MVIFEKINCVTVIQHLVRPTYPIVTAKDFKFDLSSHLEILKGSFSWLTYEQKVINLKRTCALKVKNSILPY